ncbi:MAG: carbohydrate ABC transporter permease [Candidatus Ornithospirochaeta sp.]
MRKGKGHRKGNGRKVFLLLSPILFFAILFVYYPFIRQIVNAFSRVNSKGIVKGFAGFENFAYTYGRKDFVPALLHTLEIALINVPATLFLTLFFAFLTKKRRKFSAIAETLFSLPMSVSMSAACMIFKSMFSPSVGFINYFFGIKCGWFENQETALISCIILTIWMGIGFDYLLMLSALRGIPKGVEEAVMVDGISFWRRVFFVEIPLISPTIFYVFCTNMILALMTSAPMIIIMGVSSASGATNTLMSMMYQSGFSSSDYSLAAVLSLTAFALTLVFTVLSFIAERRRVHYDA